MYVKLHPTSRNPLTGAVLTEPHPEGVGSDAVCIGKGRIYFSVLQVFEKGGSNIYQETM